MAKNGRPASSGLKLATAGLKIPDPGSFMKQMGVPKDLRPVARAFAAAVLEGTDTQRLRNRTRHALGRHKTVLTAANTTADAIISDIELGGRKFRAI